MIVKKKKCFMYTEKYRYHGSSHWQIIRTTCCSFIPNYEYDKNRKTVVKICQTIVR